MKKIIRITESDLTRVVKRVLVENDYNHQMFIDILTDMIDNFDSMDCDDPQHKYERMFCENMTDWTIDDLKKKRDFYQNKIDSSIYSQFYNANN